jgi:hypothetical protein
MHMCMMHTLSRMLWSTHSNCGSSLSRVSLAVTAPQDGRAHAMGQ